MAINRIGYPAFVPYTILDARYLKLDGTNSLSVNVLHFANYDLTMTGNASLQGTNTGDITLGTNTASALTLTGQVLGLDDKFVQWAGDTMTGNLTFSNASILEPNYIDFNTAYNTNLTEGQLGYNTTNEGLSLGLAGGTVQVNLGKELMLPRRCRNSSGTTMVKGTVVYISSASGNTPVISRAKADSEATSALTIGFTAQDINDNATGWVIITGLLSGINLSTYTAGDIIYLSPTTAGEFTKTKPIAPNHYVRLGTVTKATASGELIITIVNGFELKEMADVLINSGTVATNDVLAYNSVTQLWENKQPNTILTKGNLTESTSSVLTITGGTGAVLGSGTTIQVKQASGSQSGFLSSTDWTTFNSKQDTISVSDTSSVDLTLSTNTISATVLPAGVDHNSLANLTTGDPHTQYALLAGRSGGQTLNGGTASGNNLTLVTTSNATKGKILFGTSGYDEVNNRLGIGLDAPLTTLHARSSSLTAIRAETTAANNYAQFDLVSPSRRYSFGIGGASVTDGVADDWYLYDGTAAAYRLTLDSSGRLGIGTTSSAFNLAFGNTANKSIGVETSGAGVSGRTLTIESGTSGAGSNLTSGTLALRTGVGTGTGASYITFSTGQTTTPATTAQVLTERMRIDNAGNVGIDSTGTTSKVSISTTTNAYAGSLTALNVEGFMELQNSESGVNAAGQYWRNLTSNKMWGFFQRSAAGSPADGLTLVYYNGATFTNDIFNLYPSGNAVFGVGNVGIKTLSPSFDLSFGNAANRIISIENSAAATVGRNLSIEAGHGGAGTNIAGGTLELEAGVATGNAASNITFWTSQLGVSGTTAQTLTERMRITNQGRVGIGTTGPTSLLEVAGDVEVANTSYLGTSSHTNVAVYVDNNASATYAMIVDNANVAGYGINVNRYSFIQQLGIGDDTGLGTQALDVQGDVVAASLYADGDGAGRSSTTGFTNVTNLTANSTGTLTIKSKGTTNRDSAGFIKIYIGTTAYFVPVFTTITG